MQLALREWTAKAAEILNLGIRLEDNLSQYTEEVTTPATPDEQFSITHGLKRVPLGFWVVSLDKAAIVYKGASAWTTTTVYLKCNTATTVAKVIIF